MNAPILAAQWPKAKFTVAQIWALIEKGLIPADAKFELLDGEIIPVSPKGPLHEDVRLAIMRWLKTLPDTVDAIAETTLYLGETSFLEPDYVIFDAGLAMKDLSPAKVRLAIEVADSSWAYDIGEKAARYAEHSVEEYWAINAQTRQIRVHRGPSADGWSEVTDVASGDAIAPLWLPQAAFKL